MVPGPATRRVLVLGSFVQAHWWTVSCLPAAGESRMASSLASELGGKGLNVAIGLRRLGAHVVLVLGVGRDPAADALRALLDQEGLSTAHVHTLSERSGFGAGWVDAAGENSIVVFPGANLVLGPREVALAAEDFESAALVYGQLEIPQATVLAAFTQARQRGARTVLNPSPVHALDGALLEATDVLVLNWTEACQLLMGGGDEARPSTLEECAALLHPWVNTFAQQWPGDLVVTLGSVGAIGFAERGQVSHVATASAVVQGGDSAGAGDGFSAGLCWALAQRQPLHEALRLANACGAAVASGTGVLAHLPRWADLLERGYLPGV